MKIDLVLASPAGNITAFVLNGERYTAARRREAALSLMRRGALAAGWPPVEQTGFVYEPPAVPGGIAAAGQTAAGSRAGDGGGSPAGSRAGDGGGGSPAGSRAGLWHLEMAGGEFCGNAARSFGLLVAALTGAGHDGEVTVSVSGADSPLNIAVELPLSAVELPLSAVELPLPAAGLPLSAAAAACRLPLTGKAAAALPPPLGRGAVRYAGAEYAVYFFPGITHLIAPGRAPQNDVFFALKAACESVYGEQPAFGVMFAAAASGRLPPAAGSVLPTAACAPPAAGSVLPAAAALPPAAAALPPAAELAMTPAVYVRDPPSFVFESSCGSGSAALACYWAEAARDGEAALSVRQAGGIIEVTLAKRGGAVTSLRVGGAARLSGILSVEV